jgi:hypothetical protein
MYRLGYRNLGTKQSLVTTQSVAGMAPGRPVGAALRWYEFVASGQSVTVAQQGTYTPDLTNRWMASAAMNKTGAIAIGYSASSSDVYPAIRWTGRLATDPPGQLRAETQIQAGGGSQGYSGVGGYHAGRWGDYSSMTLDPTDDCTFWFTTEYLQSDGVFNWSTRIAKLRLPGCS